MQESDVMRSVMVALSKNKCVRLFRNNTGTGWIGKILRSTQQQMTLTDFRPLHAGLCKGSSDCIGFVSVEVTPEMVGKKLAVFTAIEVKSKTGRVTPEQKNFIDIVNAAGGFAGVARNEEEAQKIIGL